MWGVYKRKMAQDGEQVPRQSEGIQMNELKAYGMDDPEVGDEYEMYKVSDVDKVIAHHKYKRCLWTAMWCKSNSEIYNEFAADASEYMPSYEARFRRRAVLYQKWAMRWLELAKKFKETK